MTRKENAFWLLVIVLAVISSLSCFVSVAYANPTFFANGVTTGNAASTSPAHMTPGTGTSTTPVYDSYGQTFGGTPYKTEFAGLLVQLSASSTNTVLNMAVEYSQDRIDWYRNFLIDPSQYGTTTSQFALFAPFSVTWKFASSTLGPASTISPTTTTGALMIPTPFRYMRVIFSMTGANGAVWAQLVPIKEQR